MVAGKLVYSSSCTVYGEPREFPIRENRPIGEATNPYGRTKQACERMLLDLHESDPAWQIVVLRYFNPTGAHPSGELGEDPGSELPSLMSTIAQVATGQRDYLAVFGNDYPTPDGTAVRDYVHVTDVANAHTLALEKLGEIREPLICNLGTGQGVSVLQLVSAYEAVAQRAIPVRYYPRRDGDAAVAYADPTKAHQELGWTATRNLEVMCQDSWRAHQRISAGSDGG